MLVNLDAFLMNRLTLSLLLRDVGVAPASLGDAEPSSCSGVRRPLKKALTSLTSEIVAGTCAAVTSPPPPPPSSTKLFLNLKLQVSLQSRQNTFHLRLVFKGPTWVGVSGTKAK